MEQTKRNLLLKKARERQGWTQERLAELMGVEAQTIRAWERGKNAPMLENRRRLCELLEKWLAEELYRKYRVPQKVAQDWLHTNQLLLLLDGLDEMEEAARPECVIAINTYRQEHDFLPAVISCRQEEYFAQSRRLGLQRAIQLEPLTPAQIGTYLSQAGPKLEGVRRVLNTDAELRQLITTPLLLHILLLTHLPDTQAMLGIGSPEERRRALFAAYIERMLRRGRANQRYADADTKR
ncbi:helix-turn-helix transcriptional regulator [Ktedonosporobacter rubrisoli]|nr:helix-turn-helix transcriptional regulator [Ktedonosporobacter rubrisoli]